MRNELFGNNGDYFKYAVLRRLSGVTANDGKPKYKLGVVWMLEPDRQEINGTWEYLENALHENVHQDPQLFHLLQLLNPTIIPEHKNVRIASEILQTDYLFTELFSSNQRDARNRYFEAALKFTEDCELIFLDPSTNLSSNNHEPKYLLTDELNQFLNTSKTIVFYGFLLNTNPDTFIRYRLNNVDVRRVNQGNTYMFVVFPQQLTKIQRTIETRLRVLPNYHLIP